MPTYNLQGNCDDVCKQLKTTLEKQDASFNAALGVVFKPARPAQKPAATPNVSAQAAGASSGSSIGLSRKNDDGGMRSHLRGSLRIKA